MENTNYFTDSKGNLWLLEITTRDVDRVRSHVVGTNGKPVDLFEVAERGDFSTISDSTQVVINVIFWLCFEQVMERFDIGAWDEAHKKEYVFFPEKAKQPAIQKAAEWFGSLIGGKELESMSRAWEVALLNFIPNQAVREAVRNVLIKTEKLAATVRKAAEKKVLKELTLKEEPAEKSSN